MTAKTEIIRRLAEEEARLEEELQYQHELKAIITSENLAESYAAFRRCLSDYRSELFKKEREYLYFFVKLNVLLDCDSYTLIDLYNPSLYYEKDEVQFTMLFFYTTEGKCEINFESQGLDLKTRLSLDILEKEIQVTTGDLLHLPCSAKIKSAMIRYIHDILALLETLQFKVEKISQDWLDPFLTYKQLSFELIPAWTEEQWDHLFVNLSKGARLQYADDSFSTKALRLYLKESHCVILESNEKTTKVRFEHQEKEAIYLFDLLGRYPELELFFKKRIYNFRKK